MEQVNLNPFFNLSNFLIAFIVVFGSLAIIGLFLYLGKLQTNAEKTSLIKEKRNQLDNEIKNILENHNKLNSSKKEQKTNKKISFINF